MTDINGQIDFVARQMTDGEPDERFSERVLERLGERRGRPWFWIGGLLAAATAVVVVTFSVGQPRNQSTGLQPGAASQPSRERADASEPPERSGAQGSPRATASGSLRGEAPQISEAELAWRDRAIPALAPPDALVVEEIQPAPLEIRPLVAPAALVVPAIDDEGR